MNEGRNDRRNKMNEANPSSCEGICLTTDSTMLGSTAANAGQTQRHGSQFAEWLTPGPVLPLVQFRANAPQHSIQTSSTAETKPETQITCQSGVGTCPTLRCGMLSTGSLNSAWSQGHEMNSRQRLTAASPKRKQEGKCLKACQEC